MCPRFDGALLAIPPKVSAFDPEPCFNDAPIQSSDAQAVGYFGTGIANDGDILVVGASTMDINNVNNMGKAYVFWLESGEWVEKQGIVPLDVTTVALFGESVAMSGDLLAVAAPKRTILGVGAAGAVYVYRRDESRPDSEEWEELVQVFLAAEGTGGSEAQAGGLFGGPQLGSHQGVAMDGRLLIVGSPEADVGSVEAAGKAYIFLYDPQTEEWSWEATLESNQPYQNRSFGQSVAISGNRVIVGEYGASKAHIFNRNPTTHAWTPVNPPLHETASQFGWSVALDGNAAVVGANTADKAYVYRYASGSWQLVGSALTTEDSLAEDFGSCVSIDGSLVLVGARGAIHPDNTAEANVGAAYLFQRQLVGGVETWVEVLQMRSGLDPFDPNPANEIPECSQGAPDRFGEGLLLRGDMAFIGAGGDEFPEVGVTYGLAGLVYVLDDLPAPEGCVEPAGCP